MGRRSDKKLGIDHLEKRVLLHGGGFGGFGRGFHGGFGGEIPTVEERVDAIFERADEDGDGQIVADEVSERKWEHLQDADADQDGAISAEELTSHITDQLEQRIADQVDRVFSRYDEDGTGEIDLSEISGRCTGRLADADANEDDILTTEELTDHLREKYGLDGETDDGNGDEDGDTDEGDVITDQVDVATADVATAEVVTVRIEAPAMWRGFRHFGGWRR